MSTVFDLASGVTAINTILAEEANRIGQDIYKRTVHTSPWIDLIKQSAFPDGMGYQLTTLVYDRAIPMTAISGSDKEGTNWKTLGDLEANAVAFGTSTLDQPLDSTAEDVQGGRGGIGTNTDDQRSYIAFSKQLKAYSLKRAVIESPRISVEDLRFAAHRTEQLRAIMDLMTEATRYSWENRYRDEFDRLAANLVACKASGTAFRDTVDSDNDGTSDDKFEGTQTVDVDIDTSGAGNADITPDANISNAVLDKTYFQLVRKGAGANAYGRENGRPVFALVCSSEASYQLQTEAGFRDDVRYNNAKVSDLIAPLGIEKSFRGFYHLIDDLAPRFTEAGGTLTRVEPYSVDTMLTTVNADYEDAAYEVAYVIHPEVLESQIPNPFSGASGVKFNPVNYRGKFDFKNILSEATNPDGTIGFFRGVLASASKPIKTEFGYVILFKRTSNTPAAT